MNAMRTLARTALASWTAVLVLVPATAASAGTHTVTNTEHQHGTYVEVGDQNPCTGDSITVTVTGNSVTHQTYFTGSDEFWFTFTDEGKAAFTDNGVAYAGRFTFWQNFNLNKQNANFTATFTFRAFGSDGSVVIGHETVHGLWANGVDPQSAPPTLFFDKANFTCG